MTEAVIWPAAACGLASALMGNRTAWALLASLLLCRYLDHIGAPFNPFFWLGMDLVVMVFICRNVILDHDDLPRRDGLVLALFPAAWVFYFTGGDGWFRLWGSASVVATQFLLCLPWNRIATRLRSLRPSQDDHDTSLKFVGEANAGFAQCRR